MHDDKPSHQERLERNQHLAGRTGNLTKKENDVDVAEGSCAAFGYLRGIRDRADAVEFRFKDGNSIWFSYAWLGTWSYNPSEGLLLKFTGDLNYVVLVRGSNLDQPLNEGAINLTRGGLQRHRVLWLREMGDDDIRKVGETGPTIDSIVVAEFESQEAIKEWLTARAPAFLRSASVFAREGERER